MIEELRIHGVGVIDDAAVTLSPGLTVLTGETGAGKTMILTGVDLLLGGKADAALVRSGYEQASADALFTLDESLQQELSGELDSLGVQWTDPQAPGDLVCSRVVSAQGRSKAALGGRPVPVGTLAQVTQRLVRVHGQSDQVRLREEAAQRELVDRMGGARSRAAREAFSQARREWMEARDLHTRLQRDREEIRRQGAALSAALEEIDAVAPTPGEDAELDQMARMLAHAGELRDSSLSARTALIGTDDSADGSVMAGVVHAEQQAAAIAELDPSVISWSARLAALRAEVLDLADDMGAYLRTIEADPEKQHQVEERRSRISALLKKYGATIDDVLSWASEARVTVDQANDLDGAIARAREEEEKARQSLVTSAHALTQIRQKAAERLSQAVEAELRELAMPDAHVHITVTPAEDPEKFAAHGADVVEIHLQAHPGAAPRPLGKAASGGELSRIALAIEVVLANEDPVPTLVFDEVDAGIGGAVAVEVGRRLARLAASTQVVVVTHLPQVAAFGHVHVVVNKSTDGFVTHSTLTPVTGEARVKELVRMMAGMEDSASGRAHAHELLALAAGQ